MTTVPAETLETLGVREHARRVHSDVVSCLHLATGFDGSAVDEARSARCSPAGLEGGEVQSREPAQSAAHAATNGGAL